MTRILAGIIAAAAVVSLTAKAQQAPTQRPQSVVPEPAGACCQPGIGDIMAQQQQRHIKLWFAGRGGNWPLAAYEIDALQEGFDAVNNQLGGSTVKDAVGAPLAALQQAVETKDRAAFTRAFDELSAGCNSCHRMLDHAFIVIQRPAALPYGDQSFATQKR